MRGYPEAGPTPVTVGRVHEVFAREDEPKAGQRRVEHTLADVGED